MVNLANLMNLKGAISAAECKADGCHISYFVKGNRNPDLSKMTERLCAINTVMATFADSFNHGSEINSAPFRGWGVAAGEFSVFVVNHVVLIVETDKADFNEIFKVLNEEARIDLKAA